MFYTGMHILQGIYYGHVQLARKVWQIYTYKNNFIF